MSDEPAPTAEALRRRFRAIPKDTRDANQAFSVRVWRALSWLERSEAAGEGDLEGRFVPLWIAFNALYGRMADDGGMAPDRGSWQEFLARIARADGTDRLGQILWDEQLDVLRMIDSRYLFKPFWLGEQAEADGKLKQARRRAIASFHGRTPLVVLQELFERIYVLRQQIFHGAATCGGKVNRRTLSMGTRVLSCIVPAMIEIMIAAGPDADWGEICFPAITGSR